MTFEFIICYRETSEADIVEVLKECIVQALVNSQDDFEEDDIEHMIRIKHNRPGEDVTGHDGKAETFTILGFELDLPETETAEAIIEDFTKSLMESEDILHALRFEDPVLQQELADHAAELFPLEMKLRRVLSFIYLHAYQRQDPYDLLKEEIVNPVTTDLKKRDMVAATENQFFHITFSNYISLNQRRDIRQVDQVLRALQDSENYDVFREEVARRPIADESDAELLDDLQSLMNPIEQMRNCVAHNRRPKAQDRQDYRNTLTALEERLDRFLYELSTSAG